MFANWHSCSNMINGPRVLVVVEVGPLSAFVSQKTVIKVVGGIELVVPKMALESLQNLIRGLSYRQFFGLGLYGVVNDLLIRLQMD